MRSLTAQTRGVIGAVRRRHGAALALSIVDSRALVRSLFLASAVRIDVLEFLSRSRTLDDLAVRASADPAGTSPAPAGGGSGP